jgi:hypothetical protein
LLVWETISLRQVLSSRSYGNADWALRREKPAKAPQRCKK